MAAPQGWKRIAQVYGLVEQMRSAELGVAHSAVVEVERALEQEDGMRAQQAGAGRAALMLGDRAEWALAEAQRGAALIRAQRLTEIRAERDALREKAAAAHRLSRMEEQQVECAIERERLREQQERDRRAQAAADDRYLARRAWMSQQVEDADERRLM